MQDLHENHVLVIVASCKNITIIIIIIIINSVLATFKLSVFAINQCLRFSRSEFAASQYQQWND